MKLTIWAGAMTLIAVGGVASAQDTYYIQNGAYPKIGGISASGFFQTSGVGVDTVTGFDITLKDGSQSVTLCSSSAFGCTVNDGIEGESGVTDTGKKLTCSSSCLFYDYETSYVTPSGFVFTGSKVFPGATEQYRLGGYQNTTQVAAPAGSFVLAGAKPAAAPEIDSASAATALTLLLGSLAVLLGRKRNVIRA